MKNMNINNKNIKIWIYTKINKYEQAKLRLTVNIKKYIYIYKQK